MASKNKMRIRQYNIQKKRIEWEYKQKFKGIFKCFLCGNELEEHTDELESKLCFIFFVPVINGGQATIDNMRTSCQPCGDHHHKQMQICYGPPSKIKNKSYSISRSSLQSVMKIRPGFKSYWEARERFISQIPHECFYCEMKLVEYPFEDGNKYNDRLTIDHILPKGMGGVEDNPQNFKICCNDCNLKRAKIQNTKSLETRLSLWNTYSKEKNLKEDFVAFLLYSPLDKKHLFKQ